MKVSKDFNLVEFVGPEAIRARGDKAIQLIDHRLIVGVQWLRDFFDVACEINDYADGGVRDECGLRDILSTTGATYSQHKYGRAADLHFKGITPDEVRKAIRANWRAFQATGLTTIELNTPSWVHVDCRYTGLDTLYEVPFQ